MDFLLPQVFLPTLDVLDKHLGLNLVAIDLWSEWLTMSILTNQETTVLDNLPHGLHHLTALHRVVCWLNVMVW